MSTTGDERIERPGSPRQADPWLWILLPTLAVFGLIFAAPLADLIALSFHRMSGPAQVGAAFTLANYRAFVTDPFYLEMLLRTCGLGTVGHAGLSRRRLSGRLLPRAHAVALARLCAVSGDLAAAGQRHRAQYRLVSTAQPIRCGELAAAEARLDRYTVVADQQLYRRRHWSGARAFAVHDPDAHHGDPAHRGRSRGSRRQSRRRPAADVLARPVAAQPARCCVRLAARLRHGDQRLHHACHPRRQPRAGDGDLYRPAIPHRAQLSGWRHRGGASAAVRHRAHDAGPASAHRGERAP